MLREAFDWLITPALPLARRSGHLGEFVAIPARRRRHAALWAAHEARTKAAILRAAEGCETDGTALILGAGHLHDIPLADLAARFRRVILVDLAFASTTRRAAGRLGNVDCRIHDVTESLHLLPAVAAPVGWVGDPDLAFAASINLLSQLATVATRAMEEREADGIARELAQAHLVWLSRLGCPAALIADAAAEIVEENGAIVATLDPNRGVELPAADETWVWDIAPRGEIDRRYAVRHWVAATDRIRR